MSDDTGAPAPFETDEILYESGGAPEDHQLVGSVRDRAGRDDSRDRDRAGDGDRARSRVGPVIVFITITGYVVCLLLAELSAMMPDRSGGLPSYAYPAFRPDGRGSPSTSTASPRGRIGWGGSRSRR